MRAGFILIGRAMQSGSHPACLRSLMRIGPAPRPEPRAEWRLDSLSLLPPSQGPTRRPLSWRTADNSMRLVGSTARRKKVADVGFIAGGMHLARACKAHGAEHVIYYQPAPTDSSFQACEPACGKAGGAGGSVNSCWQRAASAVSNMGRLMCLVVATRMAASTDFDDRFSGPLSTTLGRWRLFTTHKGMAAFRVMAGSMSGQCTSGLIPSRTH